MDSNEISDYPNNPWMIGMDTPTGKDISKILIWYGGMVYYSIDVTGKTPQEIKSEMDKLAKKYSIKNDTP